MKAVNCTFDQNTTNVTTLIITIISFLQYKTLFPMLKHIYLKTGFIVLTIIYRLETRLSQLLRSQCEHLDLALDSTLG